VSTVWDEPGQEGEVSITEDGLMGVLDKAKKDLARVDDFLERLKELLREGLGSQHVCHIEGYVEKVGEPCARCVWESRVRGVL